MSVWINEFHYDNVGADVDEFIEVAGVAGTNLEGWSIVLYNGSDGGTYGATLPLSGVLENQSNGYGTFTVNPADSLQNGSPDGFALVDPNGVVVQFLSYEGVFTATNGPASGMTSVDVGVSETGSTPIGHSLQLTGTGSTYADFVWAEAAAATPGSLNLNQSFQPAGDDTIPPELSIDAVYDHKTDDDIVLSFNEAVTLNDAAGISLLATPANTAIAITLTVDGNALRITPLQELDPSTTYTVTIAPGAIEDLAGNPAAAQTATVTTADPIPMVGIHEVQGSGYVSPLVGQVVTVEAIVVGDFQTGDTDEARDLNGFFLQTANGEDDNDATTSEGIFVFQNNLPTDVAVGDRVQVTGVVGERFGKTQITAQDITVVQAGEVADIMEMAVAIDLPTADVMEIAPGVYQAALEAYENMLVTINGSMTVTEQFNLDRYNEIKLVAGERPSQYTVDNAPDQVGYDLHLQELAARQITYDDGLGIQNGDINLLDGMAPYNTETAPRMGDTVTDLTGILDYDFDLWRVRSVEDGSNTFAAANPRPVSPDDVGGTLKVASLNVLNYFTTLDIGTATTANGHDPRGADSAEELQRQTDKLVNALLEMDADVLGLVEMENDFEAGSPGNAIAYLVEQLNARLDEADHYAWVDPGQKHVGNDAIAGGFIYKKNVMQVADGTAPAILNDAVLAEMAGGQDLLDQSTLNRIFDGESTSRNPLAVTFEQLDNGEQFTAVVNHFKSKGSASSSGVDADQLDGAGGWNQQRELAAKAVAQWLATNPTGSDDVDQLILGDLNAYAMESPMQALAAAGFVNLEELLDDPYSYVFDGQIGSLDYALANEALFAQITGVTQWHINADEADALDYNLDFGRDPAYFDADIVARVSDHDPIIIGLELDSGPVEEMFTLQLLHLSDAEAGLLAATTAPLLGALVDYFDDTYEHTLVLSGGDNFIPGPFMTAGADPAVQEALGYSGLGVPDIAILNTLGVQASAVGNHEWDLGSATLASALANAKFPMISANLDYSNDSAIARLVTEGGQEASTIGGKFAPSAIITQGDEKIGIVGATTQMLERISSPTGTEVEGFPKAGEAGDGQETDDMVLLAEQLQAEIDLLLEQGINKIILNSHLQSLANEKALATLLKGVDIILAAGSNTAMGDVTDTAYPGREFAEGYPYVTNDADGKNTLIVSTDGEYSYLGRLVVDFDANGEIVLESLDPAISGAYAATEDIVAAVYGDELELAFAEGSIGSQVREITDAVSSVIADKDGTVYGYTQVYLEGDRTFGRSEEVNLGNLTADANAWAASPALGGEDAYIVSLKNGGGIRASIGAVDPATGDKIPPIANPDAGKLAGGISQLDLENALRFNNKLMVFDTTAEGLLNILNYAAGLNPGSGGYPQLGGIQFSYDPALPAGERVRDIALVNGKGEKLALVDDGVVLANAPATITVVTLNFSANNGDGYPIIENASNFRYVLDDGTFSEEIDPADGGLVAAENVPANVVGEQQALADYLSEFHGTPEEAYNEAEVPAAQDERIQNLAVRDTDTVLEGVDLGDDEDDDNTGGGDDDEDDDNTGGGDDDEDDDNIGGGDDDEDDDNIGGGDDDEDDDNIGGGDDDEDDEPTPADPEPIIGDDAGGTLAGTDGDDVIQGGSGNDIILAGAGDDEISGGEGLDYVVLNGAREDYRLVFNDVGQLTGVAGDDGFKLLDSIERVAFSDGILAFDFDGAAGQSFRAYVATLGREPDTDGISYWVNELDNHQGDLEWLITSFLSSDEFTQSHGDYQAMSDADFVNLMYQTVLGREGDAEGMAYWLNDLQAGASRASLYTLFSESQENHINTLPDMDEGVWLNLDLLG